MISRIETIDDLIKWIRSITDLHTKNTTCEKLSDGRITALRKSITVLEELKLIYPNPFKQCIKCGSVYPATKDWFDWNGRGRDALNGICKFCRNAYQKKHKKKERAVKSNYGYASSADLAEINYHRELDGQKPLGAMPTKKKGRPLQIPPKPGEPY